MLHSIACNAPRAKQFFSFECNFTILQKQSFVKKKLNAVALIELFARWMTSELSPACYTWEGHLDIIDYIDTGVTIQLAKRVSRVNLYHAEKFDNGRINIFAFDVLYAPYASMARVRISTKSSIVWKPSWITLSRWHSRVLRRSYFITSIFPSFLSFFQPVFSIIDRLSACSEHVRKLYLTVSWSFE